MNTNPSTSPSPSSIGHQIPLVLINHILEYHSQIENRWWYVSLCQRTGVGRIRYNTYHSAWDAIHNVLSHKVRYPPTDHHIHLPHLDIGNTMIWVLPRYLKRDEDYIYQPYLCSSPQHAHRIYLLDECPLRENTMTCMSPPGNKSQNLLHKLTNLFYDVGTMFSYNRGTLYYHQSKRGCVKVFRKTSGSLELSIFDTPSHVISARQWFGIVWIYDDALDKWTQLGPQRLR